VSICMVITDLSQIEASEEVINQIRRQKKELEENAAALNDARRASMNIMEDALAARQQAEEALEKLHHSEQDLSRAQEVGQIGSWRLMFARTY